MRKVSDSITQGERLLEDKVGSLNDHLESCRKRLNEFADLNGVEGALQTPHAQNVAQYSHVVQELSGILEKGEGLDAALRQWIGVAVAELRDLDTPRWKSLATATILEALRDCVEFEG
jgi:hypothetical protein